MLEETNISLRSGKAFALLKSSQKKQENLSKEYFPENSYSEISFNCQATVWKTHKTFFRKCSNSVEFLIFQKPMLIHCTLNINEKFYEKNLRVLRI